MALVPKLAVSDLLKYFPVEGMSYAFAYGSGVFTQKNQAPGKMTDLVFVVDDPVQWHRWNIRMNSHHYSFLKWLGPTVISFVQERAASGVYYNPFCKIGGRLFKYGVISTKALRKDLTQWNHLYIAGRLHKPVLDLIPPAHQTLADDLKKNRIMALRSALLLGGRAMTKFELFHNITKLSYIGDTRMMLAENPLKTRNIVEPLMAEFEKQYFPLFYDLPYAVIMPDGQILQDISPSARYKHLIALPLGMQVQMVRTYFKDPRTVDVEEVLADISHAPIPGVFLCEAIKTVVRGSSIRQTAQGILSAGVIKSVRYGFDKVKKRFDKKIAKTSTSGTTTPMKSIPNELENKTSSTDSNSRSNKREN